MDNVLAINAKFGCDAAKAVEDREFHSREQMLEVKMRASMRAVIQENWLEQKEESLFRAAVAGVLMTVEKDGDEWNLISESMRALMTLSSFMACKMSGIQVSLPQYAVTPPLPLYSWWTDVMNDPNVKPKIKLQEVK